MTTAPPTLTSRPGAHGSVSREPLRVVVVDDDPLARRAAASVLARQPDMKVVGAAADGAQAVALVDEQPVDVAVLDIQMPVLDGIAATAQIIEHSPSTKVVLLTTFDDDRYLDSGLTAGASAFLLKEASPSEIPVAVRAVADGGKVISPEPTRRLVDQLVLKRKLLIANQPASSDLSERELEVLSLLCDGLSNQEIAHIMGVAETTVKSHVSAVMRKMEAASRLEIVVKANRFGLGSKE